MELEKAKSFLKALETDPKISEDLKAADKPETVEDELRVYLDTAEKHGFEITAKELLSAVEEMRKECAEQTDLVEATIQNLSIDDLDTVAGGGEEPGCKNTQYSDCNTTYEDYENCWIADICDQISNYRPNYKCHYNEKE